MPDRIRALYVDDEPGLLEVARLFLEQSPEIKVETAESAKLALSSPAIASYDAIVSDYQMPDMDGIAFLKAVREKYGEIPFILFTGRGREEVVIDAINNGADFYLQKGGDPRAQFAELTHKIRQAVNRKRAQDELKVAYEQITASEEELREQYEVLASAQQKLVESQEQMAEIADTVPGVVYQSRFPPGGKEEFLFLSSRVPEVFGISAEREGFSERFFARVDPRDREELDRSIRDAVKKSVPWEFEGRFIKPSGEMIWFQGLARPVYKASGLYYNGVLQDITRRKRAEEAILENAGRLREAQEMAHLGFWSWDIATGNVEWSDEVFRIFGLDAGTFRPTIDSILARSPWPEEQDRARELVRKATESREPGSYEQRFLRPDGSTGYYYSTFQGRYDEDSTLTSMVGTVLDITSRKKAEMTLRTGKERYRSIIQNSPYGMHFYRLTPEKTLVFTGANPAADRILSISHDQFVGKTIEDAFPGLAGTEIPRTYRRVAETGKTWKTENTVYEKGMIHGVYDVTAFRTAPDSMAAMFVDITERKKAEEALRQSEERLRLFIQQAPVAIAMFDTEMRYLAASRRWMADYLLGDTEIAGRSHYEIFPEIPEDLKAVHRRGLAGEVVSSAEDTFVRQDGTVQWLSWEVRPWYTTGNAVGGIIIYSEDITSRKKAEEALREKTEELDQFFTASLDLFCIAGTEGIFRRLNPEWERTLGYNLSELEGHRFLDFVHPDDLPSTLAAVGDLSSQRNVLNFTNRYRHKDGSYRWLEWRSFPKGGLIFAAARDITERKEFEDALQQSRAELRSILEGTPVLQFVIGRDHRIIAWNKALEKYSGIPAAEIVGTDQQWRAFYPGRRPVLADLLVDNNTDDLDKWYGGKLNPAPHVEGGYEATDFFPDMGPSGTWLMFTAAPIRDADGTIIGAVETLDDVTERVRTTEALRESEEKYRSLVEMASEGITIIQNGKHVYVNPRMAELAGIPARDLMDQPFIDTIWPEDRPALMDRYSRRMRGEDVPGSYDFRVTGPGGKPRWVSVSVVKISWKGRPATLNLLTDVTERKLADAALREAGKKLALLNSVTRHDIRNQLIALQGFTQQAMKKERDPAIAGYLAKADANATRIRQQIEFMRTYQEMGASSPAWFRLDKTVEKVCTNVVTCDNVCSGAEIFSDPMLERVFSNLFDNALRHGGTVTKITVHCEESGDGLLVCVEDNGAGIPADEKEKIFEKGYGKNTGYGLFLVREILSITGITVKETGTPGKGARFEILVPKECYRNAGT